MSLATFTKYKVILRYTQFFRLASSFQGLVLVYYFTSICDVTVTKWNFQTGQDLPFKGAGQEQTACTKTTSCTSLKYFAHFYVMECRLKIQGTRQFFAPPEKS